MNTAYFNLDNFNLHNLSFISIFSLENQFMVIIWRKKNRFMALMCQWVNMILLKFNFWIMIMLKWSAYNFFTITKHPCDDTSSTLCTPLKMTNIWLANTKLVNDFNLRQIVNTFREQIQYVLSSVWRLRL